MHYFAWQVSSALIYVAGSIEKDRILAWQRQLGSSAPAVSPTPSVPEPTTSMPVIVKAVRIRLMDSRVRQELVSA